MNSPMIKYHSTQKDQKEDQILVPFSPDASTVATMTDMKSEYQLEVKSLSYTMNDYAFDDDTAFGSP